MFINPDLATRLAREHHGELLAQASRRQLQHQGQPAPGIRAAARIGRRLAAAIARAGSVTAQTAGAIWPAGPHPLGEPAAQVQAPDGSR